MKKPRRSECGSIDEVVEMIKKAKKPFIYAGGGVVAAGARKKFWNSPGEWMRPSVFP